MLHSACSNQMRNVIVTPSLRNRVIVIRSAVATRNAITVTVTIIVGRASAMSSAFASIITAPVIMLDTAKIASAMETIALHQNAIAIMTRNVLGRQITSPPPSVIE